MHTYRHTPFYMKEVWLSIAAGQFLPERINFRRLYAVATGGGDELLRPLYLSDQALHLLFS